MEVSCIPQLPKSAKKSTMGSASMEKKPFYITTPIYYVNSDPHIGSAYTTVVADVLARLHKKRGDDVFFLTGTAEHGTKIAESAEAAGEDPQAFVDRMTLRFKDAWTKLDVYPTDFIRTTEERHTKAVNLFFEKLKASGDVYEGDYEGLYCIGCEAFKKESELVNGECPLHNRKPELVKERNWFFKLSAYSDRVLEKIESNELIILPEGRKNEVTSFIKQGLEDIAISRKTAKFALPLPWDEEQTIYVWLDELFNYATAIGYESDRAEFDRYWPADYHIIGKDILKFHGIIWPALLLAIGEKVPKAIFAHGFFTVNGQKMSKTLGNVIDPVELAETYGSDAVRYFFLREVPFGQDGDVSLEKFIARYNADLANDLGNLVMRVTTMVERYQWGKADINHPSPISLVGAEEAFMQLDFLKGLTQVWEALSWGNQVINEKEPWKLATEDPEALKVLLNDLVALLLHAVDVLEPIMPKTSAEITGLLKAENIRKAEPLFKKIEV